jgi:hypothetical protein
VLDLMLASHFNGKTHAKVATKSVCECASVLVNKFITDFVVKVVFLHVARCIAEFLVQQKSQIII